MQIVYPYPEELPSKNARSIQALNTVCALSEHVPVHFFPASVKGDIFEFYGLKKPENLVMEEVRRKWGPFTWTLRYVRKLCDRATKLSDNKAPVIIYTRHVKIAHLLAKSKLPGTGIVYEIHEIFSQKSPGIADVERYVFEHADALVFISRGLEETVMEEVNRKIPHSVVPSGVTVRGDIEKKDFLKQCNEVFYVGSSRYEWKGIEALLDAVSKLDGVKLNIIGDVESGIKNLSSFEFLEKSGRIKLWGYIPPARVPKVLQKAYIGVLPTSADRLIGRKFTSPLKLLEYMAAGMAIVASDLPSTREIVTENEALLVKPGDAHSLAAGIRKVVENPGLRNNLAKNALKKVEQFSWEKRAEKIIAFLGEISIKG